MKREVPESASVGRPAWVTFALYLVTLAAYLIASFFPAQRTWGFSLLAYYPAWGLAVWLTAAVIIGGLGLVIARRFFPEDASGGRGYTTATIATVLVLLVSFYLLRVRTFFLGDGYSLISELANHEPVFFKQRELMASFVHLWLFDAIGGQTRQAAITVYRAVSILAGAIYLAAAWASARALFRRGADRLLFFLGLVFCGWMLLYFGYVENYATFVLLVLLYCLTGLLVMHGRVGKWAIVVPQVIMLAFHVFAVTLLPASIYLLLRDTRFGLWLRKLPRAAQAAIAAGILVILAGVFWYALTRSVFFQLSLVPLVSTMFVPEHYTLFSLHHLEDYINLLFLLVPGLLLLVVAFIRLPLRELAHEPVYRWLALAAAGTLGAAFIFDPKLGMPRDWDLFSFSGVPLGILLVYGIVANRDRVRGAGRLLLMASLLGFVAMSARVIGLATPRIGVAHYRDNLHLDRVKNRNGWTILVSYYLDTGDTTTALQTRAEWKRNFPEEDLIGAAARLYHAQHDPAGAERLVRHILDINPAYTDAHSFLGYIYLQRGQYDSALVELRLADALSPNRPTNLNYMAQAYYGKDEYDKAEKTLLKAASIDNTGYRAQYNLARFYLSREEPEKYLQYLEKAAESAEAPAGIVEEYILVLIRQGQADQARRVYCASDSVLADSAFLPRVTSRVPGIDSLLRCR